MLKSAAGSSVVGMVFAAVLGAAAPVGAQRSPAAAPEAKAEAYSLFLEGLRLEQGGQVPAAIEAHRRALELDTEGAEVAAELSALYARDNRPVEAIRMAEEALKIEPTNLEAHRVLGIIYAAQANAGQQFEDGGPPLDTTRARLAASHLEQARSPFAVSPGLELTLGRLYLQMRDYDKAAGVLAEFVDREPGVEEAVLLLSTAHEAAGRPADARAVLEEAVAFDPGFLRGVVALAQLLDRNEEWATAAEAYGRAAALNPSDGTLVTRQAASLINAEEPGRARDLLVRLAESRPDDRVVLYLLAQAHRELNEPARAEAVARTLVRLDPNDWRGPILLAQLLNRRHAYRETVGALASYSAAANPSGASDEQLRGLFVELGIAHYELGERAASIAALERARRAAPNDLVALAYLAQALVADRQFTRALDELQQAQASSKGYLPLVRLEAEALRGAGHLDRGAELMEALLKRRPDELDVYVAVGEYYSQASRVADAIRVLEEGAKRFPQSADVPFRLGGVLERDGRYAEAESAFQRAIDLNAAHAAALNYLGYMLAERGERLEEAEGYVKRALAVEPENGAYLDSLGWTYFKLRRFDLARPPLERAAAQLSSNSVIQDHLGDLLFELGDREAAVEAWRRALAGDGESIDPAVIEGKVRDAQGGRE